MKSQFRAILIALLLLLLWPIVFVRPFAYFAEMTAALPAWVAAQVRFAAMPTTLLIYLVVFLAGLALLLLGRTGKGDYLAGVCALISLVYHLLTCLRQRALSPVSLPIVLALALALLLLLIGRKTPCYWMADFYIMALPVWLLYDSVIPLIYNLFRVPAGMTGMLFPLPNHAYIHALDRFLTLPWQLWAFSRLCSPFC